MGLRGWGPTPPPLIGVEVAECLLGQLASLQGIKAGRYNTFSHDQISPKLRPVSLTTTFLLSHA